MHGLGDGCVHAAVWKWKREIGKSLNQVYKIKYKIYEKRID